MKTIVALRIGVALLLLFVLIGAAPRPGSTNGCRADRAAANADAQLPILAQTPPDEGPGMPGPPANPRHPGMEQRRRQLEQLRLAKLLDVLDLKDDQEAPFMDAYRAMRRQQRQIEQDRAAAIQELSSGLETNSIDQRRIGELVNRLLVLASDRVRTVDDFVTSMRKVLTPQQLGRLAVFQERFEFELLEKLRGFRGRMGQGGQFPPEGPGDSAR